MNQFNQWIVQQLKTVFAVDGSDIRGIYEGGYPRTCIFPAVMFNIQSNSDLNALGGTRIFSTALVQVKATFEGGSYVTGYPLAENIDSVLHNKNGRTADNKFYVSGSIRESEIRYFEYVGEKRYNHLGGLYRMTGYKTDINDTWDMETSQVGIEILIALEGD